MVDAASPCRQYIDVLEFSTKVKKKKISMLLSHRQYTQHLQTVEGYSKDEAKLFKKIS